MNSKTPCKLWSTIQLFLVSQYLLLRWLNLRWGKKRKHQTYSTFPYSGWPYSYYLQEDSFENKMGAINNRAVTSHVNQGWLSPTRKDAHFTPNATDACSWNSRAHGNSWPWEDFSNLAHLVSSCQQIISHFVEVWCLPRVNEAHHLLKNFRLHIIDFNSILSQKNGKWETLQKNQVPKPLSWFSALGRRQAYLKLLMNRTSPFAPFDC